MESSSLIYESPSFNRYSSNNIAQIADRVVNELLTENGFNDYDVYSFSDEEVNTNTPIEKVKENEEVAHDEDEVDFEFPVVCRDSISSPVSIDDVVSDDQISPRYPLFDRSLLLDLAPNLSNGVNSSETDSKPPSTARISLRKLFIEDRDPVSSSSSEADDLDGISPGTYCVWKPKTEPPGKHKKSNSISIGNTSKRWKVRDLLKRSYSDDNYSSGKSSPVSLCNSPVSPKQKTNNEKVKVKKIENSPKLVSAVGGGVASTKTEKPIPAYKAKVGAIRLPGYLPYRQDQLAVFANYNGSSKNMYRY